MNQKYIVRAIGVFVATFAAQMLAYQAVPTSIDAFWQPFWVSLSAGLAQAGFNAVSKGR